jgi:hypothetical protein
VNEELRSELLRRMEIDQAARLAADLDWDAIGAIDADNLPWLRSVVADHGWPGRSLVGLDGAAAAWLLVQHADDDSAFQRHCLELLRQAVRVEQATRSQLAYLTDRVLVGEGRPQEYGTQLTGRREGWVPINLRDPARVDERRAEMSLGPLADHLAAAARDRAPKPSSLVCAECGRPVEFWPSDPGAETTVTCPNCAWTATIQIVPPE